MASPYTSIYARSVLAYFFFKSLKPYFLYACFLLFCYLQHLLFINSRRRERIRMLISFFFFSLILTIVQKSLWGKGVNWFWYSRRTIVQQKRINIPNPPTQNAVSENLMKNVHFLSYFMLTILICEYVIILKCCWSYIFWGRFF